MRIGVDIDGVLNYRQEIIRACGTRYCAETGNGKLIGADAHSLLEMFGWEKEVRDDFWYKYGKYQMWVRPAVMHAAEVIQKLRGNGHEVWIITGRSNSDQKVAEMPKETWEEVTEWWLGENGIVYDNIRFGLQEDAPNDKGTYCADHGVDVMIEDYPKYLMGLDGKTHVLIFDQPYNREVEMRDSERVYSWYDVYQKLMEMEK